MARIISALQRRAICEDKSQAPDQLVRSVGMDITDPGFWDAGLKILDGMVAQVEELGAS